MCVEDRWVEHGKVLDANSSSELVVNDSIQNSRPDTRQCDFQSFHYVVRIKIRSLALQARSQLPEPGIILPQLAYGVDLFLR